MNHIVNILFLTYLIKQSDSTSRHHYSSSSELAAAPPLPLANTHLSKHHRDFKQRKKGRRWRKEKKSDHEDDNEIDLNHADWEDSALVTDLNENVIFDKHKDVELIQGDILIQRSEHERLQKRGAVRPVHMLWPAGRIYYQFMDNLGQLKVQLVKSAMLHIMDYTCVRFIERQNNETDYLNITSEKGCYSWVGKRGGAQEVSVGSGCVTMGIIAHELAHAIGFYHEQSRPDRDNYVDLIQANIKPGQLDNFKKREANEVDSLNVPYDYGSIMHYGLKDFSDNRKPTLRTIQEVPEGTVIGQRVRLSKQDIEQANLLYKCPKKAIDTVPESAGNSRSNRHSGSIDSLMIVGGSQDTTEPLCIDGMTYRGNQVLVTMCSLSKSSLKWRWTDDYQLQNDGNTLCLSVQDNHTVGGSEDVPMKMSACDSMDDKQKWICSGGFLKNLALNKCVNAAWKPYKRYYMIAVSTCDNTSPDQVISVYGKGKRYEPACRHWNMGVQLECRQQFPTKRNYLGCEEKYETMIGYEKVGKRNNLKAIRSLECCQLINSTGNVYRTAVRSIERSGSTECPKDYFVQGIRLSNIKERSLRALLYLHCIKPSENMGYENCYWDEMRIQNYSKGMNICSRGGFYMTGIYKQRCLRLNCITRIKCCSVDIHHNYT